MNRAVLWDTAQATSSSLEAALSANFKRHDLDGVHSFYTGRLPEELHLDGPAFESLWDLHPDHFHDVMMHGRLIKVPRWQQAYGRDYHYTGSVNKALPVPDILRPLHAWCAGGIDLRLNGLLVNSYDGELGHYIGKHRDSTKGLVPGAPIVTVSLGEERIFRLRPWKQKGMRDFPAVEGALFVMPWETNLAWTHEVPASTRCRGGRISVTLRAFVR